MQPVSALRAKQDSSGPRRPVSRGHRPTGGATPNPWMKCQALQLASPDLGPGGRLGTGQSLRPGPAPWPSCSIVLWPKGPMRTPVPALFLSRPLPCRGCLEWVWPFGSPHCTGLWSPWKILGPHGLVNKWCSPGWCLMWALNLLVLFIVL